MAKTDPVGIFVGEDESGDHHFALEHESVAAVDDTKVTFTPINTEGETEAVKRVLAMFAELDSNDAFRRAIDLIVTTAAETGEEQGRLIE